MKFTTKIVAAGCVAMLAGALVPATAMAAGTADIADANIIVGTGSVYDGTEQTPNVAVRYQGGNIQEFEYTVTYKNNINAGKKAKAIVTASADSETFKAGTKQVVTFTIKKADAEFGCKGLSVTCGEKIKPLKAIIANGDYKITLSLTKAAKKAGLTLNKNGVLKAKASATPGTYKINAKSKATKNYKAGKATIKVTVVEEDLENGPVDGGWAYGDATTLASSAALGEAAGKAFDEATAQLTGVNYEPIALLGTQIVNGTKYCVLCKATVVYPNAVPTLSVLNIYAPLEGTASVTEEKGVMDFDISALPGEYATSGETLAGGWTISEDYQVINNADVNRVMTKATEGLVGATYEPVALLGTQVVAGTNYAILCHVTPVVGPDAEAACSWRVLTVYEDFSGNCEIIANVDANPAQFN